jgi:hypothetical protein
MVSQGTDVRSKIAKRPVRCIRREPESGTVHANYLKMPGTRDSFQKEDLQPAFWKTVDIENWFAFADNQIAELSPVRQCDCLPRFPGFPAHLLHLPMIHLVGMRAWGSLKFHRSLGRR